MRILISLAWKNIWRSRRRSVVVIGSIAVGIGALIFLFAFLNSFNEAYTRNAIGYDYSHIQIHNPSYRLDPGLQYAIDDAEAVIEVLDTLSEVQAYSTRTIINGMAATSRASQGIEVMGIEPEREESVTHLKSSLVEGTYFEKRGNSILIGTDLAEKLHAKIRSKVVLTFLDASDSITSTLFRVEGIFDSKSPRINKGVIYVKQEILQRQIKQSKVHEVGILLSRNDLASSKANELSELFPHQEVLPYDKLAPEFDLLTQQSKISKRILTGVIMLALLFGIVNTMLMAVLERTRELGMLRAIGMHKRKVFVMILLETTALAVVGGPIGIGLGVGVVAYFERTGIDFSNYSDTLKGYGYDTIFYPTLQFDQYPILMMAVVITAIVGAIYPAIKAINLNPLEALRKF